MNTALVFAGVAGILLLALAIGAKQVLGRLGALMATKGGKAPFEARALMNRGEHQMYLRLLRAAPDGVMVLAQVQMSAFLKVRGLEDREERWRYLNRIIRLSLDYVLVDARSMMPLAGIELDGTSHRGGKALLSGQLDADTRKTQAMQSAGVPLLRIQTTNKHSADELREWMHKSLQRAR